jgi:hypothetical protein
MYQFLDLWIICHYSGCLQKYMICINLYIQFKVHLHIVMEHLLASSCVSPCVRMSAPTGWMLVKFDVGNFY